MAEKTVPAQQPVQQAQPSNLAPNPPERFWQPLASLRDEVDRIFDNFWRGFSSASPRRGEVASPWGLNMSIATSVPAVDVVEDEKEYRITAELPGLGRDDVELNLSGSILTIKGEKRDQREERDGNYYLSERRYGTLQRSFELPQSVKRDSIEAKFDNGVLTVILPKTPDAVQQTRRIEVKST